MNSPADGKAIGQGPRPGGDAVTKWEELSNYRPLADVMLGNGREAGHGARASCRISASRSTVPGKIVFQLGEEAFNQPFKTGPLIDQNGNYALFDILMNEPMFDYIVDNGLYSKQGQQKFDSDIEFPDRQQSGRDERSGTDGRDDAQGLLAHSRSGQEPEPDQPVPHLRRTDLFSRPRRRRHQDRAGLRRKEARAGRLPCRPQDEVRAAMGVDLVRARQQRADAEHVGGNNLLPRTTSSTPPARRIARAMIRRRSRGIRRHR